MFTSSTDVISNYPRDISCGELYCWDRSYRIFFPFFPNATDLERRRPNPTSLPLESIHGVMVNVDLFDLRLWQAVTSNVERQFGCRHASEPRRNG